MITRAYNWKRYWVPRDGRLLLDSQGFVQPPTLDPVLAKYLKTDLVGFDELLTKPCLVFLGEPGIGKSYALDHAAKQTQTARCHAGATILIRNLSAYSTDTLLVEDVFRSQEFKSWEQGGGELHLFLDSFDECLLRVDAVAELLVEQFRRVTSVQNLFLRVASRTAEWRTSLEDALRGQWGKESVGVYELAPLTREQVYETARVQLSNPEQFLDCLVASEVVAFAIKPLTLDLLIRVWKKRGGSLPPTQREIYEQGCLVLCEDSEKRRTPRLRSQHSAEQRLAVAAHLAAAIMFCNRVAVWTGTSRTQQAEADISVAELAKGFVTANGQRVPVTESAVREALDTGLFTSRGPNRLGWAHQTYGEFLAARYLAQESLTARQALDLLTHAHDADRKLIPQLQETAAWAAVPDSELFTHLAQVQPDVLLRSDVATADARDKFALVEALMDAFAKDTVQNDWLGMRERFRKLRYPGLAKQLRRHLSKHKQAVGARVEAIAMAEACELHELLPLLAKLALDAGETNAIRRWAAAVVARGPDVRSKKRLRPLAMGQRGPDPDDELRGAGLKACWPEHLTTEEVFASLTEPDEHVFSLYHGFLSDGLVPKLAFSDFPKALAWAESLPEKHDSFDGGYGGLVMRILNGAAEHIEADGILTALARALLSRLRKHDFSHGARPSRLVSVLESRPGLRLKLVEAMVQFFDDARHDSHLITRWGLRLLFAEDIPWLIERLESAPSPELQTCFAHLLSWVFYPENASHVCAVIEAAQTCPVLTEVMPVWLRPMVIDSDEARKARERYLDQQRLSEEVEQRRRPKPPSPSPGEQVVALLNQFEGGDVEAWWKLCRWLEIQDDGNCCEKSYHMDLRKLVGWNNAADETRARMVAAAERYVINRDCNPEQWFSRRNITYHPAVAGFRALLLLANEYPSACEALPAEVWERWAPAILRPHYYDERNEHRLLTAKAVDRAPTAAIEWTTKVINEENKEGENLWILNKLPEGWNDALGSALLQRLRQGRLKPPCFQQLLSALLERRVAGALDFARSKIPRQAPADGKRRQMAIQAAGLVMCHGERGDWPRVWNLICADAAFGKALVQGFAHDFGHSPTGILKTLTESEVGTLWEWMLVQYPIADDPDRRRGGTVTTRYAVANLRDSLIQHLANIGTAAGCVELERLIGHYPQFDWFRHELHRGREQVRRLTWQPPSPDLLFQLSENRHACLVQSAEQLLDVILASLTVFQARLQGETPLSQLLWNDTQPKPEEALSEWVKVHLEDDLKGRGVVLGREVQIHRFDRTDIHVTAVTKHNRNDSLDIAKVIIEVKGDWHRDLRTAMETQLAGRYLKDGDCRHGLYLVGWFGRTNRRRPADAQARAELQGHLTAQALSLTNAQRTVKTFVLDCSQPVPADRKRMRPTQRIRRLPRPSK